MRRPAAALLMLVAVAGATVAHAHPPRRAARVLVRFQGHPGDGKAPHPLVLAGLGTERSFAATEWREFGFGDGPQPEPPKTDAPPRRFALQGSRDLVARVTGARPEQTVTVFAEHRPGSTDLFLLSVDLCPPK